MMIIVNIIICDYYYYYNYGYNNQLYPAVN